MRRSSVSLTGPSPRRASGRRSGCRSTESRSVGVSFSSPLVSSYTLKLSTRSATGATVALSPFEPEQPARARLQQVRSKSGCRLGEGNARCSGWAGPVPPAALAAEGIDRPVSSRACGPVDGFGRMAASQHPSLELGEARPVWMPHGVPPVDAQHPDHAQQRVECVCRRVGAKPVGDDGHQGRRGVKPTASRRPERILLGVGPTAFACRPATRGRARATPHRPGRPRRREVGMQAVRERPIKGPDRQCQRRVVQGGQRRSRQAVRAVLPTWLAPRVQNRARRGAAGSRPVHAAELVGPGGARPSRGAAAGCRRVGGGRTAAGRRSGRASRPDSRSPPSPTGARYG